LRSGDIERWRDLWPSGVSPGGAVGVHSLAVSGRLIGNRPRQSVFDCRIMVA
jgi:allophanate hydrolase subunit 2